MVQKLLFTAAFFATLCMGFMTPAVSASAVPALITEVQTGFIDNASGLEYPKQEFIEIANISSSVLSLNGWRIEYLSAAHDGTAAPTSVLVELQGSLPLNGQALFSYVGYNPAMSDLGFGMGSTSTSGMLAKSGGHIRMVTADGTQIDCVAWGSAVAIAGCDKVNALPSTGQTMQRPHSDNGSYDKILGIKSMAPPTPKGGEIYTPSPGPSNPSPGSPQTPGVDPEVPEEPQEPQEPEPTEPEESQSCSVIELSEVLPNPMGDDASGEFIELYNSSDQAVSLNGCSLRLGTTGKTYTFASDAQMAVHEYKAFYYGTTALQLSNSGGEVWLLAPGVQSSLTYPSSTDDQAWALIDGAWQTTFRPTPNAQNVLYIPGESDDDTTTDIIAASIEPCPVGKYRNPATNRCKNTDSEPAACDAGQERNPETNRCRKIATTSSTTTPCEPGQERNPLTNRCRKIASSTSTTTACAEGQERNPETNRCRKVAGASTSKASPDDTAGKANQNYRILIAVLILIAGYALYEYRQDIRSNFNKLRSSFGRKGSA